MYETKMVQNSKKPKLLIKKRKYQRENEMHQKTDLINVIMPIIYGDRFIPRRYCLNNIERNQKFIMQEQSKDVLMTHLTLTYWRQNCLTYALNTDFDIKIQPVFRFRDPNYSSSLINSRFVYKQSDDCIYNVLHGFDWPCRPRLKPSAFADSTLDLPGINSLFDLNKVDWSVNGQIVASLNHEVVVWKRNEAITLTLKIKNSQCLAYCPNGKFLAVGFKACRHPVLELWDTNSTNDFLIVNQKVFEKKHSDVRCIEWTKSAKQILCGTQCGAIFVLSVPDLSILKKICKHKLPVTTIRLSPTMRYLASGDIEGNIIVYNWSSCDVYLYVRSRRNLNIIFDWHPWNGVDLIISEDVPASIVVLNVPSKEIVAYYQRRDKNIVINSIAFSRITGELLVSVSKHEDNGCIDFKVLVMSSLDCVVDMLQITESGARFVMWSPDGTQLATAGTDETLTIWNFYPNHENNRLLKAPKGRLSKSEVKQINCVEANFGAQFKMWSCLK